jgi:hypothetical protein
MVFLRCFEVRVNDVSSVLRTVAKERQMRDVNC